MQIVQIMQAISYGDGMSNIVFLINRLLDSYGISHKIVTLCSDQRCLTKDVVVVRQISEYSFESDDIVLYHYGVGGELNVCIERLTCKKILVFHNCTDAVFFRDWDYRAYESCLAGHEDIKYSVDKFLHAIVLSEFSKKTLVNYGWNDANITILPLHELSKIGDYDTNLYEKINDGFVNILFTGRLSSHKKIEDIIRIFAFYNNYFNEKSRLILIGKGAEIYKHALDNYIKENSIQNVIFTGHISDAERNAYYEAANLFLCMSEHEGFCIPLLEAFQRKIPVIAYNATAVPDTMGKAGVLVDTKKPEIVCKEIQRLITDNDYRKAIIEGQLERLKIMTLEAHKEEFLACLKRIDEIKDWKYKDNHSTWLKVPASANIELKHDFLNFDDIKTLKNASGCGIVLYGFGNVGKKILPYLIDIGVKVVAICDNSLEEKKFSEIPIFVHNEVVKNCSSAIYIVTMQYDFLSVVFSLKNSGIPENHIFFYDSLRKRLNGGGK